MLTVTGPFYEQDGSVGATVAVSAGSRAVCAIQGRQILPGAALVLEEELHGFGGKAARMAQINPVLEVHRQFG